MYYLTQEVLRDLFISNGVPFIFNKQCSRLKERGYKYRPDFQLFDKLIIEFDGYLHYTNPKTVLLDIKKDSIYRDFGYDVIRIPYFIQLDSYILGKFSKYIEKPLQGISNYPHGFIDEKAVLPAYFCELGVRRFIKELEEIPSFIKEDILLSLTKKVESGLEVMEVYPLSMK